MAIAGLVGVAVFTRRSNFDVMRRFYVEALGLVPLSDRPGFVNFEWDGIRLTVAVHSELAAANPEPRHVMINLGTDDIERDVARLRRSGVPIVRPPEVEHWGGRVATVADPDGNYVQLLEFPRV
jgi:predicted enzyme related to lactoylglutathione lyase